MLRFQHIEYLWYLLFLLPLAALFFFSLWQKNKKLASIGEPRFVERLIANFSKRNHLIKFSLLLIALFIGVLSLANLQGGGKAEKIERKGIDVMIALDVSKSMLAQDASPNRLEKSKLFIAKLLDKLANNRVGLIVFAGKAYVSVPLTTDFSALKMNLATASPNMVPTQGTVLGEAIGMARQSFNVKETKYKNLILISDGEDHDETAMDETKKAVEEGIQIHTIGIGSPEGGTIIDEESGQPKTDKNGEPVVSKLNADELRSIANEGHGDFYLLTNTERVVTEVAQQINSSEQRSFGDTIYTNYDSYFQYFLIIALLLIIIEFFISERKKVAYI